MVAIRRLSTGLLIFTFFILLFKTPTLSAIPGDANNDGKVDGLDYVIWLNNYNQLTSNGSSKGDFDNNGKVDGLDYVIWLNNYNKTGTVPTSTPPIGQPTVTPQTGELSIAVCNPANGPFSLNINNPYFPLPVGQVHVVEESSFKVQLSVLNQTEVVAGITTRVLEEREWSMPGNNLKEVSRNFFVQAPDGTVCYYGEDVDIYSGGQIVGHSGAWRAGVGQNLPGIIMPANPAVGQTYQQEVAPGVAMDRAEHVAFEPSYTTPAGTFNNVLYVKETPPSDKRYAPGIGMIYDDGMKLTQY